MIDKHDPGADSVLETVNRRALELLELQFEEREDRYELLKDQDFWSARASGMPSADAWDMSEKMDQWTREAVSRIVATGGACGGRA